MKKKKKKSQIQYVLYNTLMSLHLEGISLVKEYRKALVRKESRTSLLIRIKLRVQCTVYIYSIPLLNPVPWMSFFFSRFLLSFFPPQPREQYFLSSSCTALYITCMVVISRGIEVFFFDVDI